jgi:hypothetical protein
MPEKRMIALRLSAVLAILVGLVYVEGLVFEFQYSGVSGITTWHALADVLIPLVPGVLALFGRATFLLPAVWGWVLGVHLPRVLLPRPPLPMEWIRQTLSKGGRIFVVGPDYIGMVLVAVAILGLVLYGFGYYRERNI